MSSNPLVQKFIEQGIGQLHGFWFVEAEALPVRPHGSTPIAGSPTGDVAGQPGVEPGWRDTIRRQTAKHKVGLSERETMYIDSLGGEGGYRAIIARYPDDVEAKAFEVWRLWHKAKAGIRPIRFSVRPTT